MAMFYHLCKDADSKFGMEFCEKVFLLESIAFDRFNNDNQILFGCNYQRIFIGLVETSINGLIPNTVDVSIYFEIDST